MRHSFSDIAASAPAASRFRVNKLGANRRALLAGIALATFWTGNAVAATVYVGAVYAGTNSLDGNSIAAFGQNPDGTLTAINNFATGGLGGIFDGGGGLDPLISEDSVLTVDNRYVLAVNAGSNTISSFRINPDFTLTLIGTAPSGGVGPNSIAYSNGRVVVSNVDSDGVFTGPPDQSGNISGLQFDLVTGQLTPIAGSTRELGARPSDIEFATDGTSLVISSVNAGSSVLAGGSNAQLTTYGIMADGSLSANALSVAASTLPGNAEGRNLPTSIGFEIVDVNGQQIVIATEAREFLPNGDFEGLATFQTGSVSTFRLEVDGSLTPLSQDVLTGPSIADGPTSACWIVVAPDGNSFFVASASGAVISSYSLNDDGTIALVESEAAVGSPAIPDDPAANPDGFIDIALSGDGQFVYQLLGLQGAINVYSVGLDGAMLTLLQRTTGLLPLTNIQGIVSVDNSVVPLPAAGLLLLTGVAGLGAAARRKRRIGNVVGG